LLSQFILHTNTQHSRVQIKTNKKHTSNLQPLANAKKKQSF